MLPVSLRSARTDGNPPLVVAVSAETRSSSDTSASSALLPFQIIRVLPERHPSRSYVAQLERRFRDAEGVFVQSHPVEVSP